MEVDDLIRRRNVTNNGCVHIHEKSYKMTYDVRNLYRHINYKIGGSCDVPYSAIPAICQKAGLDYQAEVAKVISRDLATGESALCEMIRNTIIHDAKCLVESAFKSDSLVIVLKLSSEEEATLIETFPELDLNLGLSRINSVEPPPGNDALVKDSGGDVFKQIKRGRPNFHCCSPILSVHDQQRDASRIASIASITKFSNVLRRALDKDNNDVRNKTSIFFCNKVSEIKLLTNYYFS